MLPLYTLCVLVVEKILISKNKGMQSQGRPYLAKAFVSCSLRKEDKPFVDLVSNILHHFQIMPFGTVGRYDASTDNPVILMQENIKVADFIVIVATRRYFTKDAHSGVESNSISEMIHTEAGMAFANSKPVIVFAQNGTNVGSFLPSITQYITLDGTQADMNSKYNLIVALLNNAYQKMQEIRRKESSQEFKNLVLSGFAIYGGLKLLDSVNKREI